MACRIPLFQQIFRLYNPSFPYGQQPGASRQETDTRILLRLNSIKHILGTVSFTLVLLFPASAIDAQEIPTSRWWYPAGTIGATGRNDVATDAQSADDLVVKWRSTRLQGAQDLLIGAIATPGDSRAQNVVGLHPSTDTIYLLDQNGFLTSSFKATRFEGSGSDAIRLTGLMNDAAPSAEIFGRPNLIGVGLERMVTGTALGVDRAYGLLLRADGTVRTRVGLTVEDAARLLTYSNSDNRFVTVNPIAAYRHPTADSVEIVALLSQDRFVENSSGGVSDTLLNSLRLYAVSTTDPTNYISHKGEPFRIAPATYRAQPAIRFIEGNNLHVFSLATSSYNFNDTFRSPLPGARSWSGEAATMHLRHPLGSVNISGISEHPASNVRASGSMMADLIVDRQVGPITRSLRFAYDVREERMDSGPRILLTDADQVTGPGRIFETGRVAYDGFETVIANLDGIGAGAPEKDPLLVNNPGPELVVSRHIAFTEDSIHVLVYRLNEKVPIDEVALGSFTGERMRGRIGAAGDLVSDPDGREELVLVRGSSVSVLQLKPYSNKEAHRPFNPDLADPFETVATFDLDGDVRDVAIADLEGDGNNDLLVSTTEGTYLIGKLVERPFTFTTEPRNMTLCPNDTLHYAWRKNSIGGGDRSGVQVYVIGPDEGDVVQIQNQVLVGDTLLRKPVSALNLREDGEYRLVVSDGVYAWLTDTSASFHYRVPQIGALTFGDVDGREVPIDTLLIDTIEVRCIDDLRLQSSQDGLEWNDVTGDNGGVTQIVGEERASVEAFVRCGTGDLCSANSQGRRYFRVVSSLDSSLALSVIVRNEPLPLFLTPDDTSTSRTRSLTWRRSEINCSLLRASLSNQEGQMADLGTIDPLSESFRFRVPDEFVGEVRLCVECVDDQACHATGFSFEVPRIDKTAYVAPNPYTPHGGNNEQLMSVVYSTSARATVSIRIIDQSHSLVRYLVEGEEREPGRHRDLWNGLGDEGQSLANGTYFCVIEVSTGDVLLLPFILKM